MAREYAKILGLAAFAIIVTRGAASGDAVEATLQAACLSLFGFALLGYVAGRIGARAAEEAAQNVFEKTLQKTDDKEAENEASEADTATQSRRQGRQ